MRRHHKLFLFFLFLLPAQFGLHFWPNWSTVFGIRVDYFSPTIYLTDLLLFVVILLWLREVVFRVNLKFLFIALFIFINIFFAQNRWVCLWGWILMFKLALIAIYVSANSEVLREKISLPLVASLVYTLAIALAQFISRGSLGGIFYYLGERSFTVNTPGIALVSIAGNWQLRPYASFPHPNAMAGYALVSGLLLGPYKKTLSKIGLGISIILVLIAFSRSVIITGIVVFLVDRFGVVKKISSFFSLILPLASLMMIIVSLYTPVLGHGFSSSVYERLGLAVIAGHLWVNNLIVGAGLRNFIVYLPRESSALVDLVGTGFYRLLQPVHNLYLLILSETGLVGLFFFIWLLRKSVSNVFSQKYLFLCLLAIMLTGFFDHYWLMLLQTSGLAATIFGMSLSFDFVKIVYGQAKKDE